ncbi:diguanylate cyclase [Roseicitreum antarcticum]|uniref:diguanylate cyclase n=1 Tax=Roseicitreum antarcticum TaxID=564137 RepID=A0A1H2ZWJ3_9RHOB|nr:diguanylate cyclase [Roseicitreum antarcticum]SDX21029.1 two-component system, cell cycle response regulator [Roseicitreum antarcticum]
MTGNILIVDALVTNRIILRVKLGVACYAMTQAETMAQALDIARNDQPDLIITGMSLPDGPACALCARLQADPLCRDIPVLVIAPSNDSGPRMQALHAGAAEVMTRPMDEGLLLARIRSLLRARSSAEDRRLHDAATRTLGFCEPEHRYIAPARVLLITSGDDHGRMLKHRLTSLRAGLRIETAPPAEALRPTIAGPQPDLYLLAPNPDAPDADLRLIADLRARPDSRNATICVLLPAHHCTAAAMALDLGAAEVLTTPLDSDEAVLRLSRQLERKRQADRLRQSTQSGLTMAMTDPLTGLHNRRYADQEIRQIAKAAYIAGSNFAVMLLDLDRFKLVNDTYGHAVGDHVLTSVAHVMRSGARPQDLLARIGGEEFLMVLPDTTLQAAHHAADRLRRAIASTPVPLPGRSDQIGITASVGVALGHVHIWTERQPTQRLIDDADRALRGAKRQGRNCVMIGHSAA